MRKTNVETRSMCDIDALSAACTSARDKASEGFKGQVIGALMEAAYPDSKITHIELSIPNHEEARLYHAFCKFTLNDERWHLRGSGESLIDAVFSMCTAGGEFSGQSEGDYLVEWLQTDDPDFEVQ